MADQSASKHDNPLFVRYGTLIDQCFQPNMKIGAPVAIFPSIVMGLKAGDANTGTPKQIAEYANPADIEQLQQSVDKLRTTILSETKNLKIGAEETNSRAVGPMTRKLQDFRNSIESRNEAMLEDNPFYELTMVAYRINTQTLKNAFVHGIKNTLDRAPRPIKVARSYFQIWTSPKTITSTSQKIMESLGKVVSLGKLLLGILLFIGSTSTTAKGVIDLVQLPSVDAFLGGRLSGAENEALRMTLSLAFGFLLSSVILDFKNRLFIGVAETGKVFKGFFFGFKRNPRWFIIACFLTMVSIWTNYDGIVLMMSKGTDLAVQLKTIRAQAITVLGDPATANVTNPGSLWDLKALMDLKSAEAIKKFNKVPEDEMSGAASSGIAKQGPRYWGKHFIINGQYLPGKNDVATVHPKSALVPKIDLMLRNSGLDLSTSLETKINLILQKFTANLNQTQLNVVTNLATLEDMMTFKSYTPNEFITIYSLESYHVNKRVLKVVGSLEETKQAFEQAALEINQLANAYINVLREVDKIGTPANNNYEIDVKFNIPPLNALDKLKNSKVPEAKRRNLAELKNILMERYSVAVGSLILFIILAVAISMDLSDPIFYSAMVARWGKRDRHFLSENLERFQKWEEDHILRIKAFLVRPDIRPILPNLPSPTLQVLHHDFHLFLEETDSKVKDASDHGFFEALWFWFIGLFTSTRIGNVHGYNARQTAIMKYLQNPETYNPRLLNTIFPGVLNKLHIGVDHFDSLFDKLQKGLQKNEHLFKNELSYYTKQAATAQSSDTSTNESMPSPLQATGLLGVITFIRLWLFRLFLAAISGPHVPFPLSRISWLKELVHASAQSRAQINFLADFVPSLRRLLTGKLATIQKNILTPLFETMHRIPNWHAIEQALKINEMDKEFQQIRTGLHEILGLSNFQGFQAPQEMIHTIIEKTGIDEIIHVYLRRDADTTILDQRIDRLEARMIRAYRLVKNLVEEQNTLIFSLTKIRRDYLSPINVALSPLQNQSLIERSLGVDKMKHELLAIEQCLMDLWNTSPTKSTLFGTLPEERASINMDAILTMIEENEKFGEFKLHEHVKKLETRMRDANQRLHDTIHKLMVIDRMTVKIRTMIHEIPSLIEQITAQDAQIQDFQITDTDLDQRKLNFLDDNRLFFKTVPLQLDSILMRVDALLGDPNVTEPHNITLLRTLENQTFKLRYFLKNAMDYLAGKRSGIGLSASLAQLTPPLTTTLQSKMVTDSEPPANQLTNQLSQTIRQTLSTTRQNLLDICLMEWDLLKQAIPNKEALHAIQQQQSSVNLIAVTMESTLGALALLLKEINTNAPTTKQMEGLNGLLNQAENLLTQISTISNQITTILPVAYNDSRRAIERTVIRSQIELTLTGGQRILGQSRDLSPRGICFEANTPPQGITTDQDGVFKLLSDTNTTQFPCKCVRVTGSIIILTLLPGHEANFVTLIRAEIVRDRGETTGILDTKLPNLDEKKSEKND